MNISLSPEIEQLLQGIYSGGEYASQADVVSAALHLLKQRDQLRIKLQQGCDELDRGERLDADQVFGDLRKRATELDGRSA
jgi:Arc/MetJ-type ribon-helix-helix transcriptional regulator